MLHSQSGKAIVGVPDPQLHVVHRRLCTLQPKQPVEFDQAINYVNKIKVCFQALAAFGSQLSCVQECLRPELLQLMLSLFAVADTLCNRREGLQGLSGDS